MQQTALHSLLDAGWMLHLFFEQTGPLPLHDLDLSGLYDPLARALAMSFEQGSANEKMLPLRGALAHVVDVSVMWLVMNEGFLEALRGEGWMPGLLMSVVSDSIWFAERGMLDEMWNAMRVADAKRQEKGGVLEEFGGAAAATPGGGDGEGSRASSRSTASRKRRREEEKEDEGEGGFEIWVDGEPGQEVVTPRWRRHQPLGETDDWMLDGGPFTMEQRREVFKENILSPLERGNSGRPRGGTGGGILRPRENFVDAHPPVPAYNPNAGRRGANNWVARPTDEDATVNNGVERVMPNMARLR
jgi:hypothetical protein